MTNTNLPSPLRCLSGTAIAGSLTVALYLLTQSLTQTFANMAVPSQSRVAAQLALGVRYIIVSISTMAMGIAAIVTFGLFALTIQVTIQRFKPPTAE